ncbi:transposable element Tcb1 transposase [Trichonephila clavipes]|uniref:Transposable element Tcb1 transposase n=1 Tax=Trichonephila clavipes TaxID=2585209 RepID=A0A8X6SVY7_TRICX|nr:transposable element Tcb1 transposase [Trichonephila clavipes]
MTAQSYFHDKLQPHVLPLMQWLLGAIFQQDFARPHTAKASKDYFNTVTTIYRPAQSPDLSPIEQIWDHLGRRVGHPTILNELEARLQHAWNEMSQDIIQNLHASMPDRITSCIHAKGVQQEIPGHLSTLDLVSERLISPRIPFTQIRRLRHVLGQFGILGFVEWAQNEIAVVPDFHKRILFSDEAHFWLNGYVNKQNCRIWSEANPQVYVETPLHPEKLTVWCALWAGGILLQKR